MEASGSPPAADSNPDVFIVDSDPRSAEELRLITEACGYRVEVFTDGQPALERLRGHQPRLLIMELLLPVLDGFELCQAIRADLGYQQLPVLCVSGISWGSVDLADLLHKRFKARFLAKGLLVDRYLAILQDMLHEPATQSVQAVETVLKDRQEASAEAKPIEVSRLEMQAEPVVRAVMSDKLDQGQSPEIIREQTDSVVRAVLEYRKRLEDEKPLGEYHYTKPANPEAPPAEPSPPPVETPLEAPVQVIARVETESVRLGESGVRRARDLTREFQRELANVDTCQLRRDVRVQKAFEVRLGDLEGLDAEYTENISAGGLFIRTGQPPEKDSVVTLSIRLPDRERVVEAQARVIHAIAPQQAQVMGRRPGCGVEFLNLSAEDKKLLEATIQAAYTKPCRASPGSDEGINWIVLLGLPVLPMVGRPNFLLRENIRMAEFPNLPAAREFLSGHRIALVIVGETAFAGTSADQFRKECQTVLPPGNQIHFVDAGQTMRTVLDEIGRRLDLQRRAGPRVAYQTGVSLHRTIDEVLVPEEFTARMVNLSCTGMLMQTPAVLEVGSVLQLIFSLPDQLEIRCRAVVVRKRQDENQPEVFYGVAFNEFFGDAEYRLESFVQSQVDFQEFFRWMKKRYFEYP